jgi:hypothetical protein
MIARLSGVLSSLCIRILPTIASGAMRRTASSRESPALHAHSPNSNDVVSFSVVYSQYNAQKDLQAGYTLNYLPYDRDCTQMRCVDVHRVVYYSTGWRCNADGLRGHTGNRFLCQQRHQPRSVRCKLQTSSKEQFSRTAL